MQVGDGCYISICSIANYFGMNILKNLISRIMQMHLLIIVHRDRDRRLRSCLEHLLALVANKVETAA